MLESSPPRFRAQLEQWITRDLRGLMLTSSLTDPWYYEVRMAGATDRDAVVQAQKLLAAKQQLAQDIENWFVNELPHPHWRAMANRFPNMLRAFDAQTRIGTENGQTIVNGYLPMSAAPNLIYASWMAMQPGATAASSNVAATSNANTPAATPLTPDQILNRKISVQIDQNGLEFILNSISEQANDNLPPGTKPLRFNLDAAGLERSVSRAIKRLAGMQ